MHVPANDLERQIEAAFDYRGHVTITLASGEPVVGYVYNRQFAHPTLQEPPFVEVFLAGSGTPNKIAIDSIRAIALTGRDYAAEETIAPQATPAMPSQPQEC